MTMKIVVFGLSLSSSWGNGHATTWRALLGALAERGHDIVFLERSRSWFARHRDLKEPDWCRLAFYDELADLEDFAPLVAGADIVIVGSYVPDGVDVAEWVQRTASGTVAFYDIDTPVTLARLRAGDCEYLTPDLIPRFDLYLSVTGGPTLRFIEEVYGAPAARVLHCSVDETRYRETPAARRWHLGFLGTYSADRQPALERLLVEPARQAPDLRFVVAGPQYPTDIDWPRNVERIEHLAALGPPAVLFQPVLGAERHPRRHDRRRPQPVRAAVRGRRLRSADHHRRVAGARRFLRAVEGGRGRPDDRGRAVGRALVGGRPFAAGRCRPPAGARGSHRAPPRQGIRGPYRRINARPRSRRAAAERGANAASARPSHP
jgi:hypothetical protein